MSEARGKYQTEIEWARAHQTDPVAVRLLSLASMYLARPDTATLGMIDAVCAEIRAAEQKEKGQEVGR